MLSLHDTLSGRDAEVMLRKPEIVGQVNAISVKRTDQEGGLRLAGIGAADEPRHPMGVVTDLAGDAGRATLTDFQARQRVAGFRRKDQRVIDASNSIQVSSSGYCSCEDQCTEE